MLVITLLFTSTLVLQQQTGNEKTTLKENPQVSKMEPRAGKPGTVLEIEGVSLGKDRVEEVFLTDHRFDVKVKVLEQTATTLKIRIPPFVKPGRQQLLLLTGGNSPAYLEQPVWVTVEDPAEEKEKETVAQGQQPQKKTEGSGDGNKPDKP